MDPTDRLAVIQRRLDALVAQCAAIQVATRKIIELLERIAGKELRGD